MSKIKNHLEEIQEKEDAMRYEDSLLQAYCSMSHHDRIKLWEMMPEDKREKYNRFEKYRKSLKNEECEYGHICTSRCQNDTDCPCVNEHWCSASGGHSAFDCADGDDECPQHPKRYRCQECKDTGIVTKTEWTDTDTSYDIDRPCICGLD